MLPLTRVVQRQIASASAASTATVAKLAASAHYSTASPVPENIWLMLRSSSLEAKNNGDEELPKVHKWKDYSFYDIRNNNFVTSSKLLQQNLGSPGRGEEEEEGPRIIGSSHGYLATLRRSDCSLSLVKVPPKLGDGSRRLSYESHDLPCIDGIYPFTRRIFRYNQDDGEFRALGFGYKWDHGIGHEFFQTSRWVADMFEGKIVMSDPNASDWPTVVMFTNSLGENLAFCQGFDAKKWNPVATSYRISDVIYSNRGKQFYCIRKLVRHPNRDVGSSRSRIP